MNGSDIFKRDKIPFRMLGEEFNYEFLPSIHLQEVMLGITNMLTSLDFDIKTAGGEEAQVAIKVKDDKLLPQAIEVARDLLSERIYQVIADVLQYQNDKTYPISTLQMRTRPLEVAQFLDILINDPELREAIASLGKSLAGLMTNLTGRLQTPKSTPS